MNLFKKKSRIKKRSLILIGALIFALIGGSVWTLLHPLNTEAAWFDDNYAYRTKETIGNTGSADSNKKVKLDIDTATLITAGKMQSDCDDTRFTDINGKQLQYYLDSAGGACNTSSTDYYVLLNSINGSNDTIIYMYYGNPAAVSGSQASQFAQSTFSPTSGPTGATEEKGPAPVLYWELDEGTGTTAKDSSANGNTGTITTATWQDKDSCSIGKCLKFDGVNGYISRSYSSDSELDPGTSSFSISSWIKHPTSIGGTDVILSRFSSGGYILYMNSSGFICFGIDDDGTSFPEDSACSTTSYADAQWHFIEAVKSGTSSITLYIDGKQIDQDASLSSTGSLSGSSPTLYVGAEGPSVNNWDGWIDEVKIFSYAKTTAQIKADFVARGGAQGMSATLGGSDSTTSMLARGLKAYWKMDETAANSCNGAVNDNCDSSGNGNDLNWTNQATSGVGKFGGGVVLDGDDDSTQRASGLVIGVSNTMRWTIATWFKSASDTQGYIFDTRGSDGAALYLDGTDTVKLFYTRNVGPVTKDITYTASVTNTNWHHALMTRDGDNSISVYIDGQKLTPTATTTNDDISSASDDLTNIFFGHRFSGNIYPLNGTIDEGRLYNRAFTASEVQTLYDWAPGPIGYWNLDERTGSTAKDTSGNGNTTSWNGTGASHWVAGKYNVAGNFNGTDDYLLLNTLSPNTFSNITMETWMYPTALPGTIARAVNVASSDGWIGFDSSGNIKVNVYDGTSNKSITTSGTDYRNRWTHVTATADGTTLSLFLNGVLYSTTAVGSMNWESSTKFAIGGTQIGTLFFTGFLDEVKVYNYPRTQKQIVQDMNANHPAVGGSSGTNLGYWKFNEGQGTTANNSGSGGSTLNGTLTNMAAPATSTSGWTNSGKFGKAVKFDATNDYVNIPDNALLEITGPVSVSAWIKKSDTTATTRHILIKGTRINATANNYALINDSLNLIQFQVTSGGTVYAATTATAINDTNWHHIVGVYSPSSYMKIYLDGALSGTNTSSIPASITTNSNALRLGLNSTDTERWAGTIDEVKLYTYPLNSDDVKLDYNQSKSEEIGSFSTASDGTTPSTGVDRIYCVPGDTTSCSTPVGEWKFDERTGTSANDTSGNNKTLTLANGPTWAPGKEGQAILLDGSDDAASVASFTNSTSYTLEAWIYPRSFGGGNNGRILVHNNFIFYLNSASNWMYFEAVGGTNGVWHSAANSISLNAWNHVVVTYNSGSTANDPIMYINGKLTTVTKQTTPVTITAPATGTLFVGNNAASGGIRGFDGRIDTIKIFDYIRTPAQIAWDYNRGGPVGQWRFNECQGTTANDSSGNANHATITIGATGTYTSAGTCNSGTSSHAWNAGSSGKFSSAIGLDGTDDYISAPDSTSLNMTGAVSISAWVNANSFQQSSPFVNGIVDKKGQTSGGYYLRLGDSGLSPGEPEFGMDTGGAENKVRANTTLSTGQWYNIAGIFDGSSVSIYIDGVLKNSSSFSATTIGANNSPLKIGFNWDGRYFNGKIDDVRVFNYALTANQLKTIVNENSSVRFGPTSGTP